MGGAEVVKGMDGAGGTCHDCGGRVTLAREHGPGKEPGITGGAAYETSSGLFFKCEACFEKGKSLKNYQPCEVYSRIVGYLRPVGQWNKGKQCEFERRKTLSV